MIDVRPAGSLGDAAILQRRSVGDARGSLERLFCEEELQPWLGDRRIVQINRTLTGRAGTVRGMHFQLPPHCETKIVFCLRGEVFDVAVDLRPDSATYLAWQGEILSAENRRGFFIPEGHAHGFQALTDDCEMLYLHTEAYAPDVEAGVSPLDPALSIQWPRGITLMSDRDRGHPIIDETFKGIMI